MARGNQLEEDHDIRVQRIYLRGTDAFMAWQPAFVPMYCHFMVAAQQVKEERGARRLAVVAVADVEQRRSFHRDGVWLGATASVRAR